MNAEESARVKFIANKYGITSSKVDGAVVAIFVWQNQTRSGPTPTKPPC